MPSNPSKTSPEHTQTNRPAVFFRNSAIGDSIIRSVDGEHFHVHADILSSAIPLFADMLSLPQPSSSTDSPPSDSEVLNNSKKKRVILTQESSTVWTTFIPLCYLPGFRPPALPADLTLVRDLLAAADKFELRAATDWVSASLLGRCPLLKAHPLSVYALAWAYKLPEVARLAARRALALSPDDFAALPREFDAVAASEAFGALNAYRIACSAAARAVTAASVDGRLPRWLRALPHGKELVRYKPELCEKEFDHEMGAQVARVLSRASSTTASLRRTLSERGAQLAARLRLRSPSTSGAGRGGQIERVQRSTSKVMRIYVAPSSEGGSLPLRNYLEELTRALEFRPHAEIARSQEMKDILLESVVERWGRCEECHEGVYPFLVDNVTEAIRTELEKAIEKVTLSGFV